MINKQIILAAMNRKNSKAGELLRQYIKMIETICKFAILVCSGLLILGPLLPIDLSLLTGIIGIIILLSSMPELGNSSKKSVYVFLALSFLIFVRYKLSFVDFINGVNSMLSIAALVTVMQVFNIPLKVGNYDKVLEKYLQMKYKKETSLYIFLNLITHVIGSFMLFGSIPMLFTIFNKPLKKMVHDPKRFLATALGRSFSLVTLWAPGTVNVILALEVTGAKWLQVLLPAVVLAFLGLVTSVLLETKLYLKDYPVQTANIITAEDNMEDKKKIGTLIIVAAAIIAIIVALENLHILTSTTRVIAAGLVVALIWIMFYSGNPGLPLAFQSYWGKFIFISRDLAALFISMGIFAEAVYQAGLISYLHAGLNYSVGILGQYSFLLIPPILIVLSLVGIHPFISILLIGKMLVSSIQLPDNEVYIALSFLLGGVVSFVLSPFAGNVLTLSRMTDCTPEEVGYKWNGLFSLLFLLEGYAFLLVLKMI